MKYQHNEFGKGPWIQTATGRDVEPLQMTGNDVCIEDIAESLSKVCRFTGHVKGDPYSVAQHSFLVSGLVEEMAMGIKSHPGIAIQHPVDVNAWALTGLLHDATESYLCDLPRPWKRGTEMGILFGYHERGIARIVMSRFGTYDFDHDLIKLADLILLATERRDVMAPCKRPWKSIEGVSPLAEIIRPWEWHRARDMFLERFERLDAERGSDE